MANRCTKRLESAIKSWRCKVHVTRVHPADPRRQSPGHINRGAAAVLVNCPDNCLLMLNAIGKIRTEGSVCFKTPCYIIAVVLWVIPISCNIVVIFPIRTFCTRWMTHAFCIKTPPDHGDVHRIYFNIFASCFV